MLCTNCSNPVKPVVALDIDGTLGDYHSHFLRFADAYLGNPDLHMTEYVGGMQFSDWFCEAYDVDYATWKQVKLAYRQGAQKRSMPVDPDAKLLVHAVVAAGAELWYCTTRPYQRLDNVDPDTRAWLDRHDLNHASGMIYDEDKYAQLSQLVDPSRVVFVLDDLPEQCRAACKVFNPTACMLRLSNYNLGVRYPLNVTDLETAATLAVDNIKRWKDEHDRT